MEAKTPDMGELIFSEDESIVRRFRRGVLAFAATSFIMGAVFAAVAYDVPMMMATSALMFLSSGIIALLFYVWAKNRFRPFGVYEKGLVTRFGKFIPYEKLNHAEVRIGRSPYGCALIFHSGSGPIQSLHLTKEQLAEGRHIALADRLMKAGLGVKAWIHAKEKDEALLQIVRGNLLLEEPSEVYRNWRRLGLLATHLAFLATVLTGFLVFAFIDLIAYGEFGVTTTIAGALFSILFILFAAVAFFVVPHNPWQFFERGFQPHALLGTQEYVLYEECGFAKLRWNRVLGTGNLRIHCKRLSDTRTIIPVGEKKHAYSDVDRLVELLESKGVPVER